LALLIVLAFTSPVSADDQPKRKPRTISVVGQGEVKVTPDRVVISFAVETTGARATEAVAENAKRSAAVSAAVKKLLNASDIVSTARYSIEPRYEGGKLSEAREPRITGYVVRNEVQVESGRVDQVGNLIDAAAGAGANRIGHLQFTLSTRSESMRQALEKAGADARAQADSVAKGLGVTLKHVLSASAGGGPIAMPRRFDGMAMAAEARVATPIEAGDVNVSATLSVTYEIE
jgi:hypothetical protein